MGPESIFASGSTRNRDTVERDGASTRGNPIAGSRAGRRGGGGAAACSCAMALLLGSGALVHAGPREAARVGEERIVSRLALPARRGSPKVELSLSRIRLQDGGVTLKLSARGLGARPLSLVLYAGGGDDDGPGDGEVRGLQISSFEVPGAKPLVRVDFAYRPPDGHKGEVQTDTMLVALGSKLHKVVELRTRLERDRTKTCRDVEESQLSIEGTRAAPQLVATTARKAEPALGDDDLPIDKTCLAPAGTTRTIYKVVNKQFVRAEAAKPAPAPLAESEDDDDEDDED